MLVFVRGVSLFCQRGVSSVCLGFGVNFDSVVHSSSSSRRSGNSRAGSGRPVIDLTVLKYKPSMSHDVDFLLVLFCVLLMLSCSKYR